MSLIRRAFGLEERGLAEDIANGFPGDVTGTVGWQQGMVWAGYPWSTDNAMRLSAVFACLRLISEAISTLPLDTYQRQQGTRVDYPTPDYLTFVPPQGSRVEYLSQIVLSLLTDGNAYVLTPRDQFGVPVDLIPLDPTAMSISRVEGKVRYECAGHQLGPLDLMHIKGMTMPGAIVGLSPIGYARSTIDIGLAAQDYGLSVLRNGATPQAIITMPQQANAGHGTPGEVTAQRIADTWRATHGGTANAGKVGVLLGGATLNTISFSPDDAQYLETRQFQVPDIARIFGVPPHLIADASNSTSWGSGLAEQNLAFGQFSLRPWLERIENAHTRLLATHGLGAVFVKLNLDALLRASLADRYQSYAVGIDAGFLLRDEARALEDMPPLGPDGPPPEVET